MRYSGFYIILILFCVIYIPVSGQIFGGNRPSTQWYQLKTDSLRVIFSKEMEGQARDIIKSSHWFLQHENSLGKKYKLLDIILQNRTTIANGYVGLAPRRSEFFMMPELSNIELTSLPWHIQLSVHEIRHLSQFNNFNKGIARGMGVFLGEQGQALGMNAIIPDWFWEGDAIMQETKLTGQGRGRLPYFFNGYRSLWMGNKNYSFQKLRNGSLRHYIPDHYQLGYLLIQYGENRYGNDFWKKVTHRALNIQSPVYSFQQSIKKESRLSYRAFLQEAFQSYRDSFHITGSNESEKGLLTKPEHNNVISYEYPYEMEDGYILALRTSYRNIPQWVILDRQGQIQKLRVKDISQQTYYSYRNGLVAYAAYETHPRWGWENYSVIKLWDMNTDSVTALTHKTRFFQPDISPDKNSIVAVHSGTDMKSSLAFIDIQNKATRYLDNPSQYTFTYPRFASDGASVIAAVRNSKGEMGIIDINLQNNKADTLLGFRNIPIAYLYVNREKVFFSAPDRDRDALFMLNKETKELVQLKNLPNGVYQISYQENSDRVLWVTQNVNGFHIGIDTLSTLQLVQRNQLPSLDLLYASNKSFRNYLDIQNSVPDRTEKIKRYRNAAHLLNPHSWRPVVYEPDYGLQIFSDNVLNNFRGDASYSYNRNEGSHTAGINLTYGGFYPQFYSGISNTWNRQFIFNADTTFQWNESSWKAGFSVPLTFVPGTTIHRLEFNSSVQFDQIRYTGMAAKLLENENFPFQTTSFSWVHQSQQARQQIFPNWVQSFRAQYRNTLAGERGNQLLLNAGLYFPGFFRNHHIVLFGSLQSRDTLRGILFSNNFPFARGYNAVNFPRVIRWSLNYHFPLLYPDIGVGHLIYLLRVRTNIFYDYTRGRSLRTGRLFPLRSAGAELFFDTRFWNQFPLSLGVRYIRLLDNDLINRNLNPNQFELIVPMNLF